MKESKFTGGIEFFVSEEKGAEKEEMLVIGDSRTISITRSNLGVDHTGGV